MKIKCFDFPLPPSSASSCAVLRGAKLRVRGLGPGASLQRQAQCATSHLPLVQRQQGPDAHGRHAVQRRHQQGHAGEGNDRPHGRGLPHSSSHLGFVFPEQKFKSVSKSDAGMYRCESSNSVGAPKSCVAQQLKVLECECLS